MNKKTLFIHIPVAILLIAALTKPWWQKSGGSSTNWIPNMRSASKPVETGEISFNRTVKSNTQVGYEQQTGTIELGAGPVKTGNLPQNKPPQQNTGGINLNFPTEPKIELPKLEPKPTGNIALKSEKMTFVEGETPGGSIVIPPTPTPPAKPEMTGNIKLENSPAPTQIPEKITAPAKPQPTGSVKLDPEKTKTSVETITQNAESQPTGNIKLTKTPSTQSEQPTGNIADQKPQPTGSVKLVGDKKEVDSNPTKPTDTQPKQTGKIQLETKPTKEPSPEKKNSQEEIIWEPIK